MANRGSRAKERREERERKRRRNRNITMVVGAVAAVAILAMLVIVSTAPAEAPIPEYVAERYDDIPTSLDENGFPVLGDPDAPVELVEYSSFSCPACMTFHDNVYPQLLEPIRTGQASLTFVPYYIRGGVPNGEGAARAALCAGANRFWEFHDALFTWQAQYGNTAFSSNRLTAGAEALGLDVGAFNACFGSDNTTATLNEAIRDGSLGTPTLQVNGVTVENPQDANAVLQQIAVAFAPFADDFVPLNERNTAEEVEIEATEEPAVETEEATEEPVEDEATEEPTEESVDDEAEATPEATEEPADEE